MARNTAPAPSAPLGGPINLAPADWFLAPWRKLPPLPRPSPGPFDLKDSLARLSKINRSGALTGWTWEKLNLPDVLSREEAHFWLAAMTGTRRDNSVNLAARLGKESFDGQASLKEVRALMGREHAGTAQVILPLANLIAPTEIIQLFHGPADGQLAVQIERVYPVLLANEFSRRVLPYLTEADCASLREVVKPFVDPKNWDTCGNPGLGDYVTALLGMSEELLALASSWPDNHFARLTDVRNLFLEPHRLLFGLSDPRLVQQHVRRVKGHLITPFLIRGWLAHTELAGLDVLRDSILVQSNKKMAEQLLTEVASLVRAAELAPFMLELQRESKAPAIARQWLDDNLALAVQGLQGTAAGQGKLAEAAREFLQDARLKGHSDGSVTAAEPARPAEPSAATPPPKWLETALVSVTGGKSKLPSWADPVVLPPIQAGGCTLDRVQTRALLEALQGSDLAAPHPLVSAVKANADRQGLDAFAWKLFELWQGAGAAAKEKWAFHALGHLGHDASVVKLTPLIRAWPGESQHARAVVGLEVLRAIGSDLALVHLGGIAQKLKFQGLKNKAQEFMEAIARDRGLSREELADRIVPALDLDEAGGRTFDFGPRRFHLVFGDDLKPLVRDDGGAVKADLPRPAKTDDAVKAAEAVEDWKVLKKQLKEVVSLQIARLEQAMTAGRCWTVPEFESLLILHPLMRHLVRRLLWIGQSASGKRKTAFRVGADGGFFDREDRPCKLESSAKVLVAHPLYLTERDRKGWTQAFAAGGLAAIFPQLERPVHRLIADEEDATILTRFAQAKIPSATLKHALEKGGWVRGTVDHGTVEGHSLYFPGVGVTALMHYHPGLSLGSYAYDEGQTQSISQVLFTRGRLEYREGQDRSVALLRLAEVDPVVLSEVLFFLTKLTGGGD